MKVLWNCSLMPFVDGKLEAPNVTKVVKYISLFASNGPHYPWVFVRSLLLTTTVPKALTETISGELSKILFLGK